MSNSIGVDLGGTSIELGLVDSEGRVRSRRELLTGQYHGHMDLLESVGKEVRRLAGSSGRVDCVGLGCPGTIRPDGVLDFAPNLPGVWYEVDVKAILAKSCGLPVFPVNDANAAAFGEFHFGAGRGSRNMVLFTLGTGIGGGIVLDGQLWLGSHGRAAEIGHTTIALNGPRCGCGNRGCLESLAGIPAILTRTFEKLQEGRESVLSKLTKGDYSQINATRIGHLLKRAAQLKDPVALEVIEETAAYLGAAIETVVMTLDPDRIVLGGGMARIGAPLLGPVRRSVAARTPEIPFDVKHIVPARLANAGLVGAVAWARHSMKPGR